MNRVRFVVFALVTAAASLSGTALAQRPQPVVEVYKSPTCGCCTKWVTHLQAHGFATRVTNLEDLSQSKAKYQVPGRMQACHTAVVDGYIVEGHVPAADIQRLLKERPAVAGLAVPGMPIGSPGMEVPGMKAQPYRVFTFDKRGQLQVFASHD